MLKFPRKDAKRLKPTVNILVVGLLFLIFGCKTIHFPEASKLKTTQQLVLGSVGSEKEYIFQEEFSGSAIPSYKQPVKLEVKPTVFDKQTYKLFAKAKNLQTTNVFIQYIDSLANKPKYIQLQIVDKVAVIEAINSSENNGIKNYLSHNKFANIITDISVAFNQKEFDAITTADGVFLVEKTLKLYVLQLYNDNKKTSVLPFNSGVVFQYKTSNCCWQENERHQLSIVDLVSSNSNCPINTYKSSSRAKKNINYLKL